MTTKAPLILRNAGGDVPELWFYTEFGPEYCGYISANLVRQAMADMGPTKKLNIHVNSEGGDIFEALPIYNLLKNSGAKITFLIDGIAASCASWVCQSGDTIIMAENAVMMIHDPEGCCYGDAEDLRAHATVLDTMKSQIVGIYASRSTKSKAEDFANAMQAETWYSAQEALDAGLIDEIDPNKSTMVNINTSRFRNAPNWVKSIGKTEDWKRVMNERRQVLNELEFKV